MKHLTVKTTKASATITKIVTSRTRKLILIGLVLIGSVLLAAAVRAYNHRSVTPAEITKPSDAPPATQTAATHGRFQSRLSFQPEADRLRRRLGRRFVVP